MLHGNVEGAVTNGTIPPYINGFHGTRSRNAAGEYIAPQDFEWVETAQLIYTLTRPDVYNAIMMIPMTSDQLEDELGVDSWINDSAAVARVKELYPPSTEIRGYIEDGRRSFLGSMALIKQAMIVGTDKNVYVEPVIWTVEYAQRQKYRYLQTTSN